MDHLDLATTLIVIAAFVYAIAKQFMAKPVKAFSFAIVPLLALYEVFDSLPKAAVPKSQIAECAVMVLMALAAAILQAAFTEVFYQGERLCMRSKPVAVITWAAYFLIRIGLRLLYHSRESWMMWLGMAVIFGVRSFILYLRFPEIGKALSRRYRSDESVGGEQYGRRNERRRY